MTNRPLIAEDTLNGLRDVQNHLTSGALVALRRERDRSMAREQLHELRALLVLAHSAVTRNIGHIETIGDLCSASTGDSRAGGR